MDSLFLGIDIGTTKVKAVVFDSKGNELKLARRLTNPNILEGGIVTQNMEYHWDVVADTIREAVAKSKPYGEIKAIGVTGQGDGIWLLDKDGKPVGDAILWIDGRAHSYIEAWKKQNIIRKSGRVVFNGSMLAFAAWMYDNKPEIMSKTKNVVFCKDWIKYCLTGNIVTDRTDLSDASLIEVANPVYNKEHLKCFGVEAFLELLPEIRGCNEIIGNVTKHASELTGLPQGIPVINGMIDVVAAAVGNGVIHTGTACSIVGTTVYNEMATDSLEYLKDPDYDTVSVVCHVKPEKWLMTLGTMAGAPNLDWFLREFYTVNGVCTPFDELDNIVKSIKPGSEGIIYHPYIGNGGERAPFVKPSACAQFFGLKTLHTKAHMLRAVYEGVALSMKDCYRHFPTVPNSVRLAGGGSNSESWAQMFASNINIPIEITYGSEVGARGVALTAAVSAGYFGSMDEAIQEMARVKKVFEPIAKDVELYEHNYKLYTDLYEAVWNTWDDRQKLYEH